MRPIQAAYPALRFRRLRRTDALRRLAAETVLTRAVPAPRGSGAANQ